MTKKKKKKSSEDYFVDAMADHVKQQEDEVDESKKVENDPGLLLEYINDSERVCFSKAGPA